MRRAASRRRARLAALAALVLALGLPGGAAAPGPPADAVLPFEAYARDDLRALADRHARELSALSVEVAGCPAGVAIHHHGIGFRQPRGADEGAPYLTLWVWVDRGASAGGRDLVGRAADAFRRYGQGLVRRLVGRSAIYADPGVGGYGLILSWLGPTRQAGRDVAESLAVFADKLTSASFAHDVIGPGAFLARARVRAFDGQVEVDGTAITLEDSADSLTPAC